MEAYVAGNWDAYAEYYSDTARIWRNSNWTNTDGMTLQQYIEDLKIPFETASSHKIDPQIWESIVNEDGEHWVHFWGVWLGHNSATEKDYEIPVHLTMLLVENKVVLQGDFFNDTQVSLDMMALALEAGEGEHDDDDD